MFFSASETSVCVCKSLFCSKEEEDFMVCFFLFRRFYFLLLSHPKQYSFLSLSALHTSVISCKMKKFVNHLLYVCVYKRRRRSGGYRSISFGVCKRETFMMSVSLLTGLSYYCVRSRTPVTANEKHRKNMYETTVTAKLHINQLRNLAVNDVID